MTEIPTPAHTIRQVRDILAAIAREAGRRGADELVDLAGRADELVADLMPQERPEQA